ncbi:MAG: hypothetical protein BJ554DRAFT_6575, partial [Olpidium bornovanus]
KDAYNILVKHLRSYDDASVASALPVARRGVTLAVSTPGIVEFEEIFTLPAVQHLQGSKEGQDAALHALVRVFLQSDLQAYHELAKSKEGAAVTGEGTLRKMRLLTLAALGTKHISEELPYAKVAEVLQIDEDETEFWIIDGIREGLVEAKMNQLNQTPIDIPYLRAVGVGGAECQVARLAVVAGGNPYGHWQREPHGQRGPDRFHVESRTRVVRRRSVTA